MQEPRREQKSPERQAPERSEFLASLRTGALIGVALLAVLVPLRMVQKARMAQPPAQVATAPQAGNAAHQGVTPPGSQPQFPATAPQAAPQVPSLRLADFKGEQPTADARLVAN